MKLFVVGVILLLAASSTCNDSTDLAVDRKEIATLRPSRLNNASCPTWMYWNTQRRHCVCYESYVQSVVSCSDKDEHMQVGVLHGYCITHTKFDNQTLIVGSCPYNFMAEVSPISTFYLHLPLEATLVESAMCGSYNRSGQLCGDCIENYSLPVYTYHPQCIHCSKHTNNWSKYLALSLLPQTAFFVCVLILRFRGMSPHVNGFILYSQLITPPPVLRTAATILYNFRNDDFPGINAACNLIRAVLTFHSVWNMDFFRFYEPFCLHSDTSALQILALDYIIAVYPLILIILIYALVRLHYQNWRPIVLLWKPFQKCSIWFNRRCNIQNSLVDAFATFLLLSYIKFLSVSFTLLFPALILESRKARFYSPTYLYYASTTQYLGNAHIPYFLLAVACLSTFTLLPALLLCLYPCRWFQHCLNHYNLSFHSLHIFMDAFQGSYKNGTNGGRDYRYFAGGNLILMVAVYLSLTCQLIYLKYWATVFVVVVYLCAFSICHPFQQARHNYLHIMWLFLVLFFYSVTLPYLVQHIQTDTVIGNIFSLGFVLTPPLCIAYVGVRLTLSCTNRWKLFCMKAISKRCCQRPKSDPDNMANLTPLVNEDRVLYGSIEIPQ